MTLILDRNDVAALCSMPQLVDAIDGNNVEQLADGFGDRARSLDYIKTAECAADPMDPPIDPAKLASTPLRRRAERRR